jgi:hypothetical protein
MSVALVLLLGFASSFGPAIPGEFLETSILSLPDDVSAPAEGSVIVPLVATPADGILGADIRIEYDEQVVLATSVTSTDITASPAVVVPNTSIPGVILISIFSPLPLAGTGSIADIHFDVVGSSGAFTVLDIVSADLNEGEITAVLDDGSLLVCNDVDGDGDGVSECQGDCDDTDGDNFPGNPEVCDGKDNDCDGVADVPPDVGPSLRFETHENLIWEGSAPSYGLYRGDLSLSGWLFDHSCLESDIPSPAATDFEDPTGLGFYYLVSAANLCGESGLGAMSNDDPRPNPLPCLP